MFNFCIPKTLKETLFMLMVYGIYFGLKPVSWVYFFFVVPCRSSTVEEPTEK